MPITHETLGHLIGVRRPSVTSGLGRLAACGRLRRQPGGYLLAHPIPDLLAPCAKVG